MSSRGTVIVVLRYVAGKPLHPRQDAARRATVAKGQNPFATVLTCSDSRVPSELLFDQGIGDTFVVRVAGNVADTDEVGSIEYGVGHLNTPLLVVLGHTSCGAVKAVLEGASVHGSIPALVDNIAPAVARTKAAHPGSGLATLLDEAVKANVWLAIDEVFQRSAEVRDLVKAGKLKIVGAVYDLEAGQVNWLGAHAEQARLLAYTGGAGHGSAATPAATEHGAAAQPSAHGTVSSPHATQSGPAATPTASHAPEADSGSRSGLALLGMVVFASLLGVAGATFTATRRRSLPTRLVANSGLLMALLLGTGIFAWYEFQKIGKNLDSIAEDDLPILNNLADIEAQMLTQALALEKLASSGNPQFTAEFDRVAAVVDHELETVKTEVEHALKNAHTDQSRRVFQQMLAEVKALVKEHQDFDHNGDAYMAALKAGEKQKAAQLKGLVDRESHEMHTAVTNLVNEVQMTAQHEASQAQSAKNEGLIMLLLVSLTSLGIGLVFTTLIIRDVTRVLGDVTASLAAGAEQTASASQQVASASQSLAEGNSEAAASLEETSASLEEMTSMVNRNAEAASKAKTLAAETRAAADTGTTDMAEMKTAMDEIKSSSNDIAKIIKTIDEIAFQTNILALNAAVEAARAGEAGMGFAVVADEVRSLAQRSALSAKETADKIETAIAKSERGVQISVKVATSFEQITTKARAVDQYVAEIAAASQEQAQGVAQVSVAVTQMDKVTQSNAASAEELNAQAEAMLEAVGTLQKLVGSGKQASAASIPAPIHEAQGSKPAVRPATHTGARANTPSRANGNHKPTLQRSPLQASRRTPTGVANDDDFKGF